MWRTMVPDMPGENPSGAEWQRELTGLLLNSGLAGRRDYRRVVLLCGNCER
jgi:hypothetical protein